jgi:hypothetical protein
MRLSVEGNTIEKMIVEVGQERRGRYFCEREEGSRGRGCRQRRQDSRRKGHYRSGEEGDFEPRI